MDIFLSSGIWGKNSNDFTIFLTRNRIFHLNILFSREIFLKANLLFNLGKICVLGVGGFISNLSGKILTAVILKALFLPFQELFLIAYYNEANSCFNYCIKKHHLVYSFVTATAPYIFFFFF